MKRNYVRSIEDIIASNVASLSGEAPRLVPLSYVTLFKRAQEGRLQTCGKPQSVNVDHLLKQYQSAFPLLEEQNTAA